MSINSMERMYRHNGRINAALLEALNSADLPLTDTLGGSSIGYLLAHIAHFRHGWLHDLAPEFVGETVPTMQREEDGSACAVVSDKVVLADALSVGDAATLSAVQHAISQGKGFSSGYDDPTMMLARIVSHDSHHRGQIMSILRIHDLKYLGLNRSMFGTWAEA